MKKIRVLIADDHQLFRDGIRSLLESEADIEVVGEAETCEEVILKAQELEPDLILMDIRMPDGSGIDATHQICERNPSIRVLMLTMFLDGRSILSSIRAGALGYILKGAKHNEILRSVRTIFHGGGAFSPEAMEVLREHSMNMRAPSPRDLFPELTDREYQVLELIVDGDGNQDIAQKLTLASKTVNNHISNIFSKLDVADRRCAIRLAKERGI